MIKRVNKRTGFTLIELLIVIVIIAILAVGAFVALDPATRFADSRDSTRWTDVTAVLDAAKINQVDDTASTEPGEYIAEIEALNDGSFYMVGTESTPATCASASCVDEPVAVIDCVNLTTLVDEGYLAAVPAAPTAAGGTTRDATLTGYYMSRSTTGWITIGAFDAENITGGISVAR